MEDTTVHVQQEEAGAVVQTVEAQAQVRMALALSTLGAVPLVP